jgi:hypothetical protein
MRLASPAVLVALATIACSESGSGTNVATFARIPVSGGYAIGFDTDGTPLVGFTNEAGPIGRAQNGEFVAASGASVRVFAFGFDNDGIPLVLTANEQLQQVQLSRFSNGLLTAIGDPMFNTPTSVVQHLDGTFYAISGGFAQRLAPNATVWTNSVIDMIRAVRAPDGSLLAYTFSQGLVRVGGNDSAQPVIGCQLLGDSGCSGATYAGTDASGRHYFPTFQNITVFDGTKPTLVELPQEQQPSNMLATTKIALVSTFQSLFILPPGASAVAAVRTEEPITETVGLHAALDGTIYVSHGDWLGIAEQIVGD